MILNAGLLAQSGVFAFTSFISPPYYRSQTWFNSLTAHDIGVR